MNVKGNRGKEMSVVTVLGAGSWGTALSMVLADNGHDVRLWTHRKEQADLMNQTRKNEQYLKGELPDRIIAYDHLERAIEDTEAIIIVVPTKAIRDVCRQLQKALEHYPLLVHATKGIEPHSLKRISEMIHEEIDRYSYDEIVVLSGPSHAEEVALRQPTTVTVSSINEEYANRAQSLFINDYFRVYTSTDLIGLELGGALKNIIALGAGISDGLGYGDNAKAALLTRGLAEIARLGVSLGANPISFLGLSGVGDLVVTCTSSHSRNWKAGYLLGQGETLDQVLKHMGMVVEGIETTKAAYHLAKQQKIEMPITTGLYNVLFQQKNPKDVVESLMTRDRRKEMDSHFKDRS